MRIARDPDWQRFAGQMGQVGLGAAGFVYGSGAAQSSIKSYYKSTKPRKRAKTENEGKREREDEEEEMPSYKRKRRGTKRVRARKVARPKKYRKLRRGKKLVRRRRSKRSRLPYLNTVRNMIKQGYGNHIQKVTFTTSALTCSVNQCAYAEYSINTTSVVEGLIDGEILKVETGNETAEDFRVGGRQRKVLFLPTKAMLQVRNNDTQAFRIDLYSCIPKRKNTSIAPAQSIQEGLDDFGGGDNGWETNPGFWPQHSLAFFKSYRIGRHMKRILRPGQECTFAIRGPKFIYNPDEYDHHNVSFMWFTRHILIRVCGTLSHDQTSTTNIGLTGGQLDAAFRVNYKYRPLPNQVYLSRMYEGVSLDTMANGAIQAMPDVEQNA